MRVDEGEEDGSGRYRGRQNVAGRRKCQRSGIAFDHQLVGREGERERRKKRDSVKLE